MRDGEEDLARSRGLGKEDMEDDKASLDDEYEEEYAPQTLSDGLKDEAQDLTDEEYDDQEQEDWDDESEVEPAEIKSGDHVEWQHADQFVKGCVKDVLRDGEEIECNLHGVPVKMKASEDCPIGIMKSYDYSLEDGAWVDNNSYKAMPLHKMVKAEAPEDVIKPSNMHEGEDDVPKARKRRKTGSGRESFDDENHDVDDDWLDGHDGEEGLINERNRAKRKRAEETEFGDEYEDEDRKERRISRMKEALNIMNGDDLELMADHINELLAEEYSMNSEDFDWEDDTDEKEAEPPVDADTWDQIENQPRRVTRDDEYLENLPEKRKRKRSRRHVEDDDDAENDYEEDDFDVMDDIDNPHLVRENVRRPTKPKDGTRKRIRGRTQSNVW